jgi:hypothetical protein
MFLGHVNPVLVVHSYAMANSDKTWGLGNIDIPGFRRCYKYASVGVSCILRSSDIRFYVDRLVPFTISPLEDQVLCAAIMWVIGSLAFLVPAMFLILRLLRPLRLDAAE